MLDELRQIAIFAKTVDHGSFRAAAQALRLSPSVVSHHVAQLEARLGTALLYRTTRKLSLTPDGQRLLTAAHAMLQAAESGLQDIAFETRQPSGVLRLTVPAMLSQSSMVERFAHFSLEYPQVQLSVDFSDARRDLIADGFDIAIRTGAMKDSTLKALGLFDMERKLVASPQYLRKQKKPKTPDELVDWDWLEMAPVWQKKQEFRRAGKRKQIGAKKTRLSVNNVQALAQMAQAGAGLAVVPAVIAEPLIRAKKLVHVLPGWALTSINTFAVWPANAPREGLIRLFLDHLRSTDT